MSFEDSWANAKLRIESRRNVFPALVYVGFLSLDSVGLRYLDSVGLLYLGLRELAGLCLLAIVCVCLVFSSLSLNCSTVKYSSVNFSAYFLVGRVPVVLALDLTL